MYQQITENERYLISTLQKEKLTISNIARIVGKHRSTIYREFKRNTSHDNSYRADHAQGRANTTRVRSRKKPQFSRSMIDYVFSLIKLDWSPEQISFVLKFYNILSISHETVYRLIWADKKTGGTLYKHLRQAPKKRRKRYATKERRGVLGGKSDLASRPTGARNRSRKGHSEIDLVHGKGSNHCILTLVDRKSRHLIILKLKNKTNEEVNRVLIPAIIKHKIRTITADNGTEWHGYAEVEKSTGTRFFFAKPYHSWERGTNENMNGLIRQYFPKGQSMGRITQEMCDHVADKLNRRPRKILNYSSPNSSHFDKSPIVALPS